MMGMSGPRPGLAQPAADSKKVLFGSVKSFNAEKRWGHIECEAAKAMHGKDVFLVGKDMPNEPFHPGTLLSFKVISSPKGPQASEIRVIQPGCFSHGGQPGQQFQGEIKTFNAEKKWGFISGDIVRDAFGKDIFANLREFTTGPDYMPKVGDHVTFHVEIDEKSGQPQARQIFISDGSFNQGRSAPY